ncbi:YbiU family protein, partial [Klebsiella pneumoniae]|uniref:YbiU family protein n=1 Tax=Klebsiella pneumoniae TaxID=573 RepID=UPI003745A3E8
MALLDKIKSLISANETATQNIEEESVYDTLTPKIITDSSVKHYFDALDFAFSKQDVKNIAITGPYGAGKSTVIQSYLKTHLNREFINVSLADFSLSGKSDEAPLENSEIELSILQQEIETLKAAGQEVWPTVPFRDIAEGTVSDEQRAAIKRRGCAV